MHIDVHGSPFYLNQIVDAKDMFFLEQRVTDTRIDSGPSIASYLSQKMT